MKSRAFLSIVFAIVFILCFLSGCATTQAAIPENSILHTIDISNNTVIVKNVKEGMSSAEVINALGLEEEDYELSAFAPIEGLETLKLINSTTFYEFEDYGVNTVYSFMDGRLYEITYNVAFWSTDFEEAFAVARNAYQFIDQNLNVKGYDSGVSLNELANGETLGSFMRQWRVGEQNLNFTISHQDWSEATHHQDMETLVSVQFNIGL